MDLSLILSVYVIVLIILIFVLYKYGITIWSSIILSLIFSFILLNALKPLSDIDPDIDIGASYGLYLLIQFMTPIIVVIYAIVMGFLDSADKVCTIEKQQTCSLNNNYFGKGILDKIYI